MHRGRKKHVHEKKYLFEVPFPYLSTKITRGWPSSLHRKKQNHEDYLKLMKYKTQMSHYSFYSAKRALFEK